jgi:hypothetical protein
MGPLPIVSDELVSGIGNMTAQGGKEIERGTGNSTWRASAGTAVMILGALSGIRDVGYRAACDPAPGFPHNAPGQRRPITTTALSGKNVSTTEHYFGIPKIQPRHHKIPNFM